MIAYMHMYYHCYTHTYMCISKTFTCMMHVEMCLPGLQGMDNNMNMSTKSIIINQPQIAAVCLMKRVRNIHSLHLIKITGEKYMTMAYIIPWANL